MPWQAPAGQAAGLLPCSSKRSTSRHPRSRRQEMSMPAAARPPANPPRLLMRLLPQRRDGANPALRGRRHGTVSLQQQRIVFRPRDRMTPRLPNRPPAAAAFGETMPRTSSARWQKHRRRKGAPQSVATAVLSHLSGRSRRRPVTEHAVHPTRSSPPGLFSIAIPTAPPARSFITCPLRTGVHQILTASAEMQSAYFSAKCVVNRSLRIPVNVFMG